MRIQKINKNQKILFAVIFLTLVSVLAIYKILYPQHSTIVSGQLSGRSKQFLQSQKNDTNSTWNDQNFENTNEVFESKKSGTTFATDCFTVSFPFSTTGTKTENEDGKCVVRTRTISPASQLVISTQKIEGSLDELSSVQVRRKDVEKYAENDFTVNGYDASLQFIEEDTVTIFLTKKDILITVAFSTLSQPERLTEEIMRDLINQITLFE